MINWMDKNVEQPKNVVAPGPERRARTIWGRIFAVIRLTMFIALIAVTAVIAFPFQDFLQISFPWVFLGAAAAVIFISILLYFLVSPQESFVKTAFDLESMTAVVIGMITIILLGILTLLTSSTPNLVTLGLILMAIYIFYIYRIIRDTLRIQQENEELKKKYGELVEMDKEKSDFIMVTSHQLRTPLTEVKWSLESLVREANLDDTTRTMLKKSLDSANRMARIVSEMFAAQTVETETLASANHQLQKEPVDAGALIEEILAGLDLFARQKEVGVSFKPPENKMFFDADRHKIKIALENIIDNAMRYSPKGTVRIALDSEGKNARIRVEDTGIGIDNTDYSRVFTKFYRGKNALLLQPDGSGIGLYASKNIIEQHGGTVSFFSELKKGTIFILTIPLAR